MKKSQNKGLQFKGVMTAFLAMIFILMLSVVAALIESASIQITKNRKRADTLLALESTFAEYQRELLEEYEIFARYGCTESVIKQRLSYYGAKNMEHELIRKQLLTDSQGAPFYHMAVRYMKDWLGAEHTPSGSEYNTSSERDVEEKEQENAQELDRLLTENEAELPAENNPLESVGKLKNKPLLSLIVPKEKTLSTNVIELSDLPSKRELEKGNWQQEGSGSTTDKVFFLAYVTEHFSNQTTSQEGDALLYEQEYLIGGFAGDQENLESVCKKIMNIRTVANYTYLLTDSAKQAEAEAMAATLCTLLTVPGITQVVKYALLFAWAYGESIVDMRALLKGNKVPAVKNSENWQLQLTNLLTLGTENEITGEKNSQSGLSYSDYLKILLTIQSQEILSIRCLDLIECNLHIRTDECMTKAEIRSEVNLRRGIQDIFTTSFEYQ